MVRGPSPFRVCCADACCVLARQGKRHRECRTKIIAVQSCLAIGLFAVALLGVPPAAFGQAYPSRPIYVIVPYAAGASGDLLARVIGAKLTEAWGQQVVVENKPGAAGTIGAGMVFNAPADG